ncbi:uncharacterized protein MELLADRAFT_35886 [Melampsora larici-populina 98AG31]|uniref:CAP-Gly domain-containing protein n=1 Tax=Melampsora larici-populina (strain 98AG31 / pathotype 3-4-7) TaxID=747676 RepID=F4RKU8_MELLP|nr:uncharacterized protein MELLADRAFT_35886 [Melampsora larici-populina 98AG31]EGG06974.1 hypothetical protein MELLADRAFT_35886 [Melampsora larici-populina 98AG31]
MSTKLVTVWISSTDSYSERRLSPHLLISQLKTKLEPITGIPINSQKVALNLVPGQSHATHSIFLDDDNRTLLEYGVQEGSTIDVIDTDPTSASKAGQYNDVSGVEKFEISPEEYAKRRDTLRAFKERNKLGRFADEVKENESEKKDFEEVEEDFKILFPLGSRCEVSGSNGTSASRGTIRFVGPVEFNKTHAFWVGIELDEPDGKNDGSVMGVRYFSCQASHGTFVQPERVTIGDFPTLDPFADEEL